LQRQAVRHGRQNRAGRQCRSQEPGSGVRIRGGRIRRRQAAGITQAGIQVVTLRSQAERRGSMRGVQARGAANGNGGRRRTAKAEPVAAVAGQNATILQAGRNPGRCASRQNPERSNGVGKRQVIQAGKAGAQAGRPAGSGAGENVKAVAGTAGSAGTS